MNLDFTKIRIIDGDKRNGFEEFVCQIARNTSVPDGSVFQRFRGSGGDGGVECIYKLPNGEEWGWQSKYFFQLDAGQIKKSVETALKVRPNLKKYIIAIPFNLTAKTNRKGKSEEEKYEDYKKQWIKIANELGRDVSFELLTKSDLIDELTKIDSNGGKQWLWFNEQIFNDAWFKNQIHDAVVSAGPRYTPRLNIRTPISNVFDAFGQTSQWEEKILKKADELEQLIKSWDNCLNRGDWDGKKDFPKTARQDGDRLLEKLKTITQKVGQLYPHGLSSNGLKTLWSDIYKARELAYTCRDLTKEAVEAEHGEGKADSVGFKQFMQEYQVSFPTRHYDATKNIIKDLNELGSWVEDAVMLLPHSSSMLLSGPAGIGKTHSICDVCVEREKQGLKSILLLGHQFNNSEPWSHIKNLLGIQPIISRDQLLDALNSLAEASGAPLIFFIDAINETEPKNFWVTHLSSFLEQVKRFPWLKVCFSCRTTFINEVLPEQIYIPTVEHKGFEGIEFDACFEFFNYYNLEPPVMPLLQPEYSNPLFLKLLCESFSYVGEKIPEGIIPFNILVDILFNAKNKKLANILNYDGRENRVKVAMDRITQTMHLLKRSWLKWEEAKGILEELWPSNGWSESLFNNLLKENLLNEDIVSDSDDYTQEINIVTVSYERLGDHILATKYLSEIESVESLKRSFKAGELSFLNDSSYGVYEYKGLIEAFAVQIPFKYKIEIDEVITISPKRIKKIKIESLQWRNPGSITSQTVNFFKQELKESNREDFYIVADALLSISAVPNHPLNANWIHNVLSEIPMISRDGKLSPFFHLTYSRNKNVDRLIRWGLKADINNLTKETATLWVTMLAWFTSASDRRVRDYATKAMVRIGEIHPRVWKDILIKFFRIDDEYVIERCLASAYGTFLRTMDKDIIFECAMLIYRKIFAKYTLYYNALIVDYARLIIEQAEFLGSKKFKGKNHIPPYLGIFKLDWPSKEFVEQYSDMYWELPKLYRSCIMDDFEKYTVPAVDRKYKKVGIEHLQVCRWIFKHVLDMGYDSGTEIAKFDAYLLAKHGGGRSRPGWVERVGKKYQWIALYRIAFLLFNKYPNETDFLEPESNQPSLLVKRERNIDPSVLIKSDKSEDKSSWWNPINYRFVDEELLSDEDWIKTIDFPDNEKMILINDEWAVLNCNYTWTNKPLETKSGYPKREIWMHLNSYLIKKDNFQICWKWLEKQHFMGRWMPEGYELDGGFVGEYPWATPFSFLQNSNDDYDHDGDHRLPCKMIPTGYSLNSSFSFDAYKMDSLRLSVPSELFFNLASLRWNTLEGFINQNGEKVFCDPSLIEEGPQALLVKKSFLLDFLIKNDYEIIWTVLSEKLIHTESFSPSSGVGRLEYSRVHSLKNGNLISSKPIIKEDKNTNQ